MITFGLMVLAVLAYLGNSLVMLTSVAGMAVALWGWRRHALRTRIIALVIGAIGASLAAEVVHLVYHIAIKDQPDHGGFWMSALLVGLINAVGMLPFLAVREFLRRRAVQRMPEAGKDEPTRPTHRER